MKRVVMQIVVEGVHLVMIVLMLSGGLVLWAAQL